MDEEILELMEEYGIDEETAEKMQEYIDQGIEEEYALELAEEF